MGFSVSGSAAIVLIAAFVSVGILYSAAYNGYEDVTAAEENKADRLLEQRNTDISVSSTSYNSTEKNFTIEVLNEGATTLSVEDTDLVLDGEFQSSWVASNVSGSKTTDVWAPGETLNITVAKENNPGRVKVVTGSGVSVTEVL